MALEILSAYPCEFYWKGFVYNILGGLYGKQNLYAQAKDCLLYTSEVVLTPMMKQFFELKAKHPDAIMLFRCRVNTTSFATVSSFLFLINISSKEMCIRDRHHTY